MEQGALSLKLNTTQLSAKGFSELLHSRREASQLSSDGSETAQNLLSPAPTVWVNNEKFNDMLSWTNHSRLVLCLHQSNAELAPALMFNVTMDCLGSSS